MYLSGAISIFYSPLEPIPRTDKSSAILGAMARQVRPFCWKRVSWMRSSRRAIAAEHKRPTQRPLLAYSVEKLHFFRRRKDSSLFGAPRSHRAEGDTRKSRGRRIGALSGLRSDMWSVSAIGFASAVNLRPLRFRVFQQNRPESDCQSEIANRPDDGAERNDNRLS